MRKQYFLYMRHESSCIRTSYTMGCSPVREDNPLALASGLSYVHADNPWYTYLIPSGTYISVDLAQHGLFCVKVGKGGIIEFIKRVEEKR